MFRVKLPILDRRSILDNLRQDAEFLSGNNIMDYSLLLGIEYVSKSKVKESF